jgi:HK97 family phage prohead protease
MDYKRLPFEIKAVSGRTVSGYAATWQEDQGGDTIVKGAFAKTLAERGDRVKVLWQHWHPIGKPIKMIEDDTGLFVEYTISKTPQGDEAMTLIEDRVIDTMSIGYEAIRFERDQNFPDKRKLIELKLFEFSPVTFAMNETALITGVKSMREALRNRNLQEGERNDLLAALDEIKGILSAATPPSGTSHRLNAKDAAALADAIKNYRIA